VDRDGFLIAPPGHGPWMLPLPSGNGITRLTAGGATMVILCGYLSRELQRPVVDETGLAGKYDFHLTFASENALASGNPATPEHDSDDTIPAASDPAATLVKAVEVQLGLKMVATQVPTDILVIDHVDRIPVEN